MNRHPKDGTSLETSAPQQSASLPGGIQSGHASLQSRLEEHRGLWEKKAVVRRLYTDYYRRITQACVPGPTLEVGGGPGNLKQYRGDVISTDIAPLPWLDAAADAQALPFRSASFSNVVAVDVLHHIERPLLFLEESARVLANGGRLVLLEPGISPLSRLFFALFHPEPVDLDADPLEQGPLTPNRDPFESNQAVATILTNRLRDRLAERVPNLQLISSEWLSLFAYPLSGGFRPWSLIPAWMVNPMLKVEDRLLAKGLGKLCGFRLLLVFERHAHSNAG